MADDRLGRVLDKLYLSGLSQIFATIAIGAAQQFNVSLETAHLDASSFHVHGEYESNLPEVYIHKGTTNTDQKILKKFSQNRREKTLDIKSQLA